MVSYENGTIILEDAYTIPSDIYDDYTYKVTTNNTKNLKILLNNYYLYGIDSINVKYSNNSIYELNYVLTDGKINIGDIMNNIGGEILRDSENIIVAKKYELDDFNIMVCENDKTIFANKNYELNANLCN